MIVLGIDPDTQASGIAMVDVTGDKVEVLGVAVADTSGLGLRGTAAALAQGDELARKIQRVISICGCPNFAVVEGQQIYSTGSANANNLIPLAMVAGIAAHQVSDLCEVRCPLPSHWKGQIDKKKHHAFIREQIGWPTTGIDCGIGEILRRSHKEVLDAIGLAIYGAKCA